jgi:hypothetical protein
MADSIRPGWSLAVFVLRSWSAMFPVWRGDCRLRAVEEVQQAA